MSNIEIIIKRSYNNDFEDLKNREFVWKLIFEMKFYEILEIDKLELLKAINCIIDNINLISDEHKKSFEIVIEQLGLWGHKIEGEICKNDYIRNKILDYQRLDNIIMTKEQKLLHIKLKEFLKSTDRTFFLSAPTSFGKSFIISSSIKSYKKILVNVPTKALLTEYCKIFSERKICTNPHMFNTNDYDVFIGTPERILLLDNFDFEIAITDEGYDVNKLEARDLIFIISQKLVNCKNIVILPNIEIKSIIYNYTQADINVHPYSKLEFKAENSPVTFNEYNFHVKGGNAKLKYGNEILEYKFKCDKDAKVEFANSLQYIYDNHPFLLDNTIVYFPSKKINKFIQALPDLNQNKQVLDEGLIILKDHIRNRIHPKCEILDFLDKGIGIHNADLDDFTKKMMEYLFKSHKINFLVATSTIAKGVNLPCKNIFFVTQRFKESIIDGKNTVGRAGRFKQFNNGNRIYVNLNKRFEDTPKVKKIKSNDLISIEKFNTSMKSEIKNLIAEDKRFTSEFKKRNKIENKSNNNTNYYDYFTGYSKRNAIKQYVSNSNIDDLTKLMRHLNEYSSLVNLFDELSALIGDDDRRLFKRNSNRHSAYIYNFLQSDITMYQYIQKSLRKCEKWSIDIKKEEIDYNGNGNIKFNSNDKRHINILINNSMKIFNDVEFEVQTLLNTLIKYVDLAYNINPELITLDDHDDFCHNTRIINQLSSLNITFDFVQNNIIEYCTKETNFNSISDVKEFVNSKMAHESETLYIINTLY